MRPVSWHTPASMRYMIIRKRHGFTYLGSPGAASLVAWRVESGEWASSWWGFGVSLTLVHSQSTRSRCSGCSRSVYHAAHPHTELGYTASGVSTRQAHFSDCSDTSQYVSYKPVSSTATQLNEPKTTKKHERLPSTTASSVVVVLALFFLPRTASPAFAA